MKLCAVQEHTLKQARASGLCSHMPGVLQQGRTWVLMDLGLMSLMVTFMRLVIFR